MTSPDRGKRVRFYMESNSIAGSILWVNHSIYLQNPFIGIELQTKANRNF